MTQRSIEVHERNEAAFNARDAESRLAIATENASVAVREMSRLQTRLVDEQVECEKLRLDLERMNASAERWERRNGELDSRLAAATELGERSARLIRDQPHDLGEHLAREWDAFLAAQPAAPQCSVLDSAPAQRETMPRFISQPAAPVKLGCYRCPVCDDPLDADHPKGPCVPCHAQRTAPGVTDYTRGFRDGHNTATNQPAAPSDCGDCKDLGIALCDHEQPAAPGTPAWNDELSTRTTLRERQPAAPVRTVYHMVGCDARDGLPCTHECKKTGL